MNKITFLLAIALLFSSNIVFASHNDNSQEESVCGFSNLTACFTGFLEEFFDASLKPLIDFFKELIITSASPDIFKPVWSIIVLLCSLASMIFIIFNVIKLVMYAEYQLKRHQAKEGLKNIVIIAVLLPLSYYIYTTLLSFNSSLTNNFIQNINTSFFEVKFDNITSSILNLLLYIFYIVVLIITDIILVLRYFILSVGIVIFPLGIFMYYIDQLKCYGVLIINFLLSNIFAGFITSLILMIISMLSKVEIFQDYQVIFSISGLLITDAILVIIMFFVIIKASFHGVESVSFLTRFL